MVKLPFESLLVLELRFVDAPWLLLSVALLVIVFNIFWEFSPELLFSFSKSLENVDSILKSCFLFQIESALLSLSFLQLLK